MVGSSPPDMSGRVFISYRREETAYPAGWLYDRLARHFGSGQVFKDVDSIQLGDDYVEVITRAVGSCDVLLALIGSEWLTMTDAHGRRRIDDPADFVRLEIEAALRRGVRVIPVLVGGARMPDADELPDSLAALARRQALELSSARFDFDISRLLKVLDRTLVEVRATQQDAAPMTAPTAIASNLSPTVLPEALVPGSAVSVLPSSTPVSPSHLAQTLTGHTDEVWGVAFRPDGRLLATTSFDKTARLWNPATGDCLRTLTGHTDGVLGVAFSPDGYLLATTSFDKTARLWNPATGDCLRTLTGHTDRVRGVAFSPDGHLLATTSSDKTAWLWT
jgi:WD40 repeat protein